MVIESLHLTAVRTGDDLELTIRDTTDRLIVRNWFHGKCGEYQVEQIRFGDGTIRDVDTIEQTVLLGTPEDDTLIGYAEADTINGLAGNDTILGNAGDDFIDGGAGDDRQNDRQSAHESVRWQAQALLQGLSDNGPVFARFRDGDYISSAEFASRRTQ
jgi:hypothetical protein